MKDAAVSKQAANPGEPKPAPLPEPPPPAGISETGAAIWRDLAATLHAMSRELLTAADLPVFRMLVESMELYAEAQKKIDVGGATLYAGRSGRTYANPAIAIRAAAIQEITKLSALFGLTPSHRAAMRLTPPKPPGESGPESGRRIR